MLSLSDKYCDIEQKDKFRKKLYLCVCVYMYIYKDYIVDEWIRKLWYIYTVEYYSAIQKNILSSSFWLPKYSFEC